MYVNIKNKNIKSEEKGEINYKRKELER